MVFLRWLIAAILLLAAILKWRELAATPLPGWRALGPVPLLLMQIAGEALLAIWLISALLPRGAWALTTIAFAGFLAVSLWKAARGEISCGCFGGLSVNPWYTAALDAAVLAGLCFFRRQAWHQPSGGILGRLAAGAVAMLAAGAFAGVWLTRPTFANLGSAGELPSSGPIVYFNASEWIGKPLPLLPQIDIGQRLAKGRWIIAIHDSECHRCRQIVPEYQQLAAQWQGRSNAPGIALIDVSPAARSPENAAVQPPALKGRVLSEREWFIITPTVVAIEEGKVVAVNDTDEDAAQWVARAFTGH